MEWYRSSRNKVFGGICGGLGEEFGLDPNILRLGLLSTLLLTPIIFWIYLLLVFFLKQKDYQKKYRIFYRAKKDKWLLGICLGLAYYTKTSVWFWRLCFIGCLMFSAGWFVIFYLIAGYVFRPLPPQESSIVEGKEIDSV